MGAAVEDRPDPRLVALGLAHELVIEFPPGMVEVDLMSISDPEPRVPPIPTAPAPPPSRADATLIPEAATAPPRSRPDPTLIPKAVATAVRHRVPRMRRPSLKRAASIAPSAPPAVTAAAPTEAAPPLTAAPAIDAVPTPAPPPPPALPRSEILLETGVLLGRLERPAALTLERLGLRMTGARDVAIPWTDVLSVEADGDMVRIRSGSEAVELIVAVDGVPEPLLSAPFSEVIREASTGQLDPDGTAAVQLINVMDRLRERFRDADDPMVALTAGGAGAFVALVLLVMLPGIVSVIVRPSAGRDAFLLISTLSALDPRVIAAALGAGAATASLVARVTLGEHAGPWTRGMLRGWHADRSRILDRLRRTLALSVRFGRIAAVVSVAAVILSLPSARDQTTVDPRGVHAYRPIPFFDRNTAWNEVVEVVKIPAGGPHTDGFAVVIRASDGPVVSTADLHLVNGTDAYFFDMVGRWRGR